MIDILINELNNFDVIDCSGDGEELEYVLIKDTLENRKKINLLLCTINSWAFVPEHYSGGARDFFSYCEKELEGTLDVAYLAYNFFENLKVSNLWFSFDNREWMIK